MAGNGFAVASIGGGILLVYSGITGRGFLPSIATLVQGKSPGSVPKTVTIQPTPQDSTSTDTPPSTSSDSHVPITSGSPKAILQQVAQTHGWTGAEWTALDAIEMQEAGYDPTNTNPSSKAYGLAQSLGHGFAGGPASNGINEYGGQGLSPDQSRAASMGDPYWQSVWMCNYIASRYGDPIKAEQFHLVNNWY